MYGIRLRLKTTITGDIRIEIIGAASFCVAQNCPNEQFGDLRGGGEERAGAGVGGGRESLSPSLVCLWRCWGRHKQLHLLPPPPRALPQLMISDDIIRQSAHKQMLEALAERCQLSRFAFL